MDLLLTEHAYVSYWDQIVAAARDAANDRADELVALRIQTDGTFLREGEVVAREDAAPEVAWMSMDLGTVSAGRPLFGLVRRSSSLRWFQIAGAGVDAPIYRELYERGVSLTNAHVTDIPIAEYVVRAVLDHYQ